MCQQTVQEPLEDILSVLGYSDQVHIQLMQIGKHRTTDLTLSVLKPMGAKWLVNAFPCIQDNPDMIKNGFKDAGIAGALSSLIHNNNSICHLYCLFFSVCY